MKQILTVLVLLGAGFGLYNMLAASKHAPDLTFENAAGEQLDWSELREGKRHLLAAFLLPNCGMSEYSAELVNDLHGQYGDTIAFVGLAFGNAGVADRYKRDHALGFTVVGLRSVTDPYAGQEFFETVRKAYGSYSGVYGGTVVVLNAENEMVLGLSEKDVRELPDRLAEL